MNEGNIALKLTLGNSNSLSFPFPEKLNEGNLIDGPVTLNLGNSKSLSFPFSFEKLNEGNIALKFTFGNSKSLSFPFPFEKLNEGNLIDGPVILNLGNSKSLFFPFPLEKCKFGNKSDNEILISGNWTFPSSSPDKSTLGNKADKFKVGNSKSFSSSFPVEKSNDGKTADKFIFGNSKSLSFPFPLEKFKFGNKSDNEIFISGNSNSLSFPFPEKLNEGNLIDGPLILTFGNSKSLSFPFPEKSNEGKLTDIFPLGKFILGPVISKSGFWLSSFPSTFKSKSLFPFTLISTLGNSASTLTLGKSMLISFFSCSSSSSLTLVLIPKSTLTSGNWTLSLTLPSELNREYKLFKASITLFFISWIPSLISGILSSNSAENVAPSSFLSNSILGIVIFTSGVDTFTITSGVVTSTLTSGVSTLTSGASILISGASTFNSKLISLFSFSCSSLSLYVPSNISLTFSSRSFFISLYVLSIVFDTSFNNSFASFFGSFNIVLIMALASVTSSFLSSIFSTLFLISSVLNLKFELRSARNDWRESNVTLPLPKFILIEFVSIIKNIKNMIFSLIFILY